MGLAGGCTVAGILVAWTMYHSRFTDSPRVGFAPTLRAVSAPAALPSVLWLLSIGVSQYRQPAFNLRYADVDARAVAVALERQAAGPVYSDVKSLVLTNDAVTRESVLDSMEHFLGQAGVNDVVAIFVAGHGVQDRGSGSYYFLPFPATAENLVTTALRMSDFDEMVRVLRHNVRAVVLMLDTCHAGALQVAPGLAAMDEPGARLSVGEGFFLLAATKPGEESQEVAELGHGAFTSALLEGLQGGADAGHDGLLSVTDLFGYVAREVPRLTRGAQHPYSKVEGTDLVFAAVRADAQLAAAPVRAETALQAVPQSGVTPVPNTIGVMEFRNLRDDAEHDWVGKALRVAFNTELSKVRALHVYAPELIDRTASTRRTDQLSTAQELGIDRLVTGSFNVVGSTLRIDARIVDATSGLQEGSDSVQGELNQFFDLQKKLVLSMLRRLQVKLSPEEGSSIQNETNTNVDAYRLLLETEGVVEEPTAPTPAPPSPSGHSFFSLSAPAFGDEIAADVQAAVRAVVEEYRRALEHKDLDQLAALYVSFPPRQREALQTYLDNAVDFAVEFADVTVAPHGQDVAVSYTRRDRFVDKASGKPVRLEVRLTRVLVPEGGTWKITGGR